MLYIFSTIYPAALKFTAMLEHNKNELNKVVFGVFINPTNTNLTTYNN
jgi:hypothetical protein